MKFSIIFFTFLLAFSKDFITDIEYGKMLYKNPRGVGCNKCHGEKGEGMVIAKYVDFNKSSKTLFETEFKTPSINALSLQEFTDAVLDSKDVMPTYFLTKDEIIALYKYLKQINLKETK